MGIVDLKNEPEHRIHIMRALKRRGLNTDDGEDKKGSADEEPANPKDIPF